MTNFTYSLDKSSYSWQNALFWGNFVGHCRKAKEGSLGNRLVHAFIAVVEFLPIVSQISSIFEKLSIDNFSYSKSMTYPLTDKKISTKTNPSTTQSVSQLFSESNISDILVDKSQALEDENSLCSLLNFQNKPGRHTIKSPVVGSRADELLAVKKAMKSESILAKLQKAIYKDIFIYLIPTTKKDEADDVARGLFLDYISKYSTHGCTEQNIVDWCYSGMPACASNKVTIYDLENEWNTWCVHAVIEARHGSHNEKYNGYLPPHVVAYHELMHVEETPLRAKKITEQENGNELLTVIKTIILLDTVYKKIYGIDEATEVDYNKFIDINGTKIKLGRFANFYREKESELEKLYLALISPESIKFLKGKIQ
jgi:hypothetical protein